MDNIKQFIIQCIEQAKGDDYIRSKLAFSKYTSEEMQQQHGESGFTRQQILDQYKNHVDKCGLAINTVKRYIKN